VKKIAVILLLLIYGSATMGTTVHLHYCMDEFVGWSLFHSEDEKCGKCGMIEKDKEGGCCKDEHKHFKLKVDHQKAGIAQFIDLATPILPVPITDCDFQSAINVSESYPTSHAPPDIGKHRLHIVNCVFLI
jgi:hypothetical protein